MLHIGDADVHFFFPYAARGRNAPCSKAECKGTLPGGVWGSLVCQMKGEAQLLARCLRLRIAPTPVTANPVHGPPCTDPHNLAILARNTCILHVIFCMEMQADYSNISL